MSDKDINKIHVPRFNKKGGFEPTLISSKVMRRIKSKDTKPEIAFRNAVWAAGIRYRKKSKLLGHPDLVLKKHKLVIFIDGDFWHGYNWTEKKARLKSNKAYWIPKIERNIQRDIEVTNILSSQGWVVLRFWEHQVKNNLKECIMKVIEYLKER